MAACFPDLFAVRVSGTSMDGGERPLRDGDWAVMRVARGAPASAVEGKVVLVQLPSDAGSSAYQIKRLKKQERGPWLLTSDNPDGPTIEATGDTVVIARLDRAVRPENLAQAPGTVLDRDGLTRTFAIDADPTSGRHGGHLFVVLDRPGALEAPDRFRYTPKRRRPSEPAYVLAKRGEGRNASWRYLGVARHTEDDDLWHLPDVDFEPWRAFGAGRSASHQLPEGALARAEQVVATLLALPTRDRWIQQAQRRVRILGAADRGGLRIGGPDLRERTVSLADIAWVAVAADDAREHGGALDEARVNKLRYLEGTPKGSTRFIDTGWAVAAWARVAELST